MTPFRSLLTTAVLVVTLAGVGPGWADTGDRDTSGLLERGTHLVGGSLSFTSAGGDHFENEAGDRTEEWTLRPGGGTFVLRQVALSFHLEGQWFSQGDVRITRYAIGPTADFYFDTVGDEDPRGYALPYLGIGYLWGTSRDESASAEYRYNSGMFTATAGLTWLLTDHVATDFQVNYRSGRYTEKKPESSVNRNADRWSFFFGFKAFLY